MKTTRTRKRRSEFGLWWLGSAVLHGGLFFALLYFTPLRRVIEPARNAAAEEFNMNVSAESVRSVVEDIRERQKVEFQRRLDELAKVQTEMRQLEAEKVEQFNAAAKDIAQNAPETIRDAATEALAAQDAALKAQNEAGAAMEKAKAAQAEAFAAKTDEQRATAQAAADAARKASLAAQDAASLEQTRVGAAQAKIAQQMEFFRELPVEAKQAQAAAAAAQANAAHGQSHASDQREQSAPPLGETKWADTEAIKRKQSVEAAEKKMAEAETKLTAAREQRAALEPKAAEAQKAADAAKPQPDAKPTPEEKKQAAELTTAARKAASDARRAQTEADSAEKSVARNKTDFEAARTRLAQAVQKANDLHARVREATDKIAAAQTQATDAQRAAREAQAKAQPALRAAVEKASAGGADNVATTPPPSGEQPPPQSAAQPANLADIYNTAVQTEAALSETYKNVRAAELAMIRKIPLAEARKLTEVATPVRPEVNKDALTGEIRDARGVKAQEKEIEKATAEMESMVALAKRMRELAKPADAAPITSAWVKAQSQKQEKMEELAFEDEGKKAKDLTAAMKGEGSAQGADTTGAAVEANAQAAAALMALNDGGASLLMLLQSGGLKLSASSGGGRAAKGGASAGGGGEPPPVPSHFKPIPGRRVAASMHLITEKDRHPQWMYLDSWYVIGPWPNPARKNLDTKFPPESVIDLNATYIGGRQDGAPIPVCWRFQKSPDELVIPNGLGEYEIYYGFTEVWFDDAQDLWVAIGSDDQSKVWLNDQLVWKSNDNLKGWRADEGLRRIHFKKGLNRVVVRLENGWHSGGYSFIICTDPGGA
jgi:hypothetical protein